MPLLVNQSNGMDSKREWVFLSDSHLARYLADSKHDKDEKTKRDIKNERHERLVTIVEEAIKQNPFDTEDISAKTCKPDDTVNDVLEKMVTFWVTLCLSISLHFHLKSSIKIWSPVGVLKFQKWFDVNVLDFQIQLRCIYLGIF